MSTNHVIHATVARIPRTPAVLTAAKAVSETIAAAAIAASRKLIKR
jgi:hypothetical protein